MTGPEVLDVARDAIYTLIIVSAPVMLVGWRSASPFRCCRRSRKSRK